MIMMNAEKNIEVLHQKINVCTLCGLCEGRTKAVPGEGSNNPDVMFIGEAPGRNEDETGRPFCGSAGKNLDLGLKEAGLNRGDVFITSMVKCRPPKNRNPKQDELEACNPYLKEQIRLLKPKIVVLLGNFALHHLFDGDSISKVHGKIKEINGIKYYPMFHPAAIIYNRKLREEYFEDFRNLSEIIKSNL